MNEKDFVCEDVNECRTKTHRCDKNAICGNTVGSYVCDCKEGGNWYGDGFDCYYHDPCWNSIGIHGPKNQFFSPQVILDLAQSMNPLKSL